MAAPRTAAQLLNASMCLAAAVCAACAAGIAGNSTAAPAPPARTTAHVTAAALAGGADVTPHATMLRYPAVSATHIAFAYANQLWLVPRAGGVAAPVAAPPGPVAYPRFSPDGSAIAFVGNYEGNRDIYTIPTAGGMSTRVTYHPASEQLCGWTPDGKLLYTSNGTAGLARQSQLFTVAPTGGMPERVPVPYSGFASVSPDGVWLAYTPHSVDNRTWKRYSGGMATDVWLFNLKDHTSKKITDWPGTDTLPMWHGTDVYYLSDDGPQHRLNIWKYDTGSGKREQVTTFSEDDVRWPSMGPGDHGQGEIVFQLGSQLRLLDLGTRQVATVSVTIPGDRPTIRPRAVNAAEHMAGFSVSPSGKRVAVEARGDIWTLPAREGAVRDLTPSDESAERDPAWSPDGKWIAYFSDKSGEYELWVTPADGKGEAHQLTHLGAGFRYNPTWSPDSKRLTYTDKAGGLFLCTLGEDGKSAEVKTIDTDPWDNQMPSSWSQDSGWVAYARADEGNSQQCIWIYSVASGEKHRVTDRMFDSDMPAFDRKGDFLYFRTTRHFQSPIYGETDSSFVYAGTQVLAAAPLRADVKSPWAPKNDEEEAAKPKDSDRKDKDGDKDKKDKGDGDKPKDDAKPSDAGGDKQPPEGDKPASKDDEKKDGDKKEPEKKNGADKKKDDKPKEVKIDFDGMESRVIQVPVKPGNFGGIAVTHDGKLVYVRGAARGSGGDSSLKIFDPLDEKKEEKTVIDGVGGFDLSADGKKLAIRKGRTMAVVDAAPSQNLEKPVPTGGMRVVIDPRAEWKQIFTDAWRIERDFFYDPNMHGVDWPAMREHYGKMLDDCASRLDVAYVIGEMISELNVGHAYVTSAGDVGEEPTVPVGLLGCDFELVKGESPDHPAAYKISKIYGGAPWDIDSRGPLAQPGVGVKPGQYLLAVNGVPVDTDRDPWAALVGTADRTITITVSDKPVRDETAKDVIVKPIGNETGLRYRDWVEHNRRYVLDKTSGKIGYIHVPDTGVNGQNELVRQFYGQRDMEGLIIDDRWNAGGQIPNRFIELLNRPPTNYWARRDGQDWPWPSDASFAPKCMLINGLAGSGGDAFPAYFRKAGLGKLIGMRTWGGLVGISGNPGLVDGGAITVPTFGFYKLDGTWGIEGHGVDPDMPVVDDPAKMQDGGDPQLDAAITYMLQQTKDHPYKKPPRPKYPDRKGMGIPESDW